MLGFKGPKLAPFDENATPGVNQKQSIFMSLNSAPLFTQCAFLFWSRASVVGELGFPK